MKSLKLLLSVPLLTAVLGFVTPPASADADGVLFRARFGNTNYCHMQFPAIREETLHWDRPVLKDPSSGDIVDFYGPCDYDPRGKEAVRAQLRIQQRLEQRD